jgi:hypothetical protein
VRAELQEKSIELPKRCIWVHAKRKNIEAGVHTTFSMLGGVPGMALWAHKNPNLFYPRTLTKKFEALLLAAHSTVDATHSANRCAGVW